MSTNRNKPMVEARKFSTRDGSEGPAFDPYAYREVKCDRCKAKTHELIDVSVGTSIERWCISCVYNNANLNDLAIYGDK